MSLEDEIQERLVTDTESILENNLDRVENLFQLHGDGTVAVSDEYRDTDPEERILIYFVAQRFSMEGNIAEKDTINSEFFYKRIGREQSTIRNYLKNLRDSGFISKNGKSQHRLVVENLPDALDRLEEAVKPEGDDE